ncbi:MAG: chemotaxis protein CheW [Gammaproteobacteria bacterium]|nr:MAG: chemotaxis protein CheW [Gammaproteobacteria bacterium]
MAGVLESVDQRTSLVGENRLELLLFRLDSPQLYGINVFKVREVLQCPKLTMIPKRNPIVRGIAHIRGGTISVLDLQMAIGFAQLKDIDSCFVIITEYNSIVQGFLVNAVERIVNMNWEKIHPPPVGSGRDSYLTAVTDIDEKLVEIIDVEKVLAEVSPRESNISEGLLRTDVIENLSLDDLEIVLVDDSSVARKQMTRCIEKLGIKITTRNDGRKGLEYLLEVAEEVEDITTRVAILISDIEMPEMDGYTLTAEVRSHPQLQKLHVLLHTSLSGVFNEAMVKKVGADDFLAKFYPDELARRVASRIEEIVGVQLLEDLDQAMIDDTEIQIKH